MRLRMNRALLLQQLIKTPDGAGGFAESWESLGTIWAHVAARTGSERGRKNMGVSRVDYRISVRASPVGSSSRPVPGQRFREGDRKFRILAVAEKDEDARLLTCFAREELAT